MGPTGQVLNTFKKTSFVNAAVSAHILVKEHVLDDLAKDSVIGDALVQLEVFDDLLDHMLDLLVEKQVSGLTS